MGSEPMRALSVRQPWAWAICHGKDVENRSKGTKHRGLLVIHASKSAPYKDDLDDPRIVDLIAANGLDDPAAAQAAVVAVAELAGCHEANHCFEVRPGRAGRQCSPWAHASQFHWQLANVRPLAEPVPCKGALGLWRLPEDVEKLVRAQLEAGSDEH
jgi:hypothetical protein